MARHAHATVVGVNLADPGRPDQRSGSSTTGCGFDTAAVSRDTYGLASMAERAAIIGGRVRVVSRVGAGTRVVVRAPTVRPAAATGVVSR